MDEIESFDMTAFKNLPPWGDFVKGRESDMLRMRKSMISRLKTLHQATLAAHSEIKTAEEEQTRFSEWREERAKNPKRRKKEVAALGKCAECAKWYAAASS